MKKHELKREPTGDGAYRVFIEVNGDPDDRHLCGTFREIEPGRWQCTSPDNVEINGGAMMDVDSIEELMDRLAATMFAVPIAANRLTGEVFGSFALSQMEGLYKLAKDADCIEDFLTALTRICGGVLATAVKEDKRTAARNQLFEGIDESMAHVLKMQDAISSLKTKLTDELLDMLRARAMKPKGNADGE